MNIISKITPRPMLSLPFGKATERPSNSPRAATLSRSELKRIVAAMVG